MRIEPTIAAHIDSAGPTQGKIAEASGPTVNPDACRSSEDLVDLSQVSTLAAKAMDQPEIRMDNVEAIKAQIAAGTYELEPSKIADAMISSEFSK